MHNIPILVSKFYNIVSRLLERHEASFEFVLREANKDSEEEIKGNHQDR